MTRRFLEISHRAGAVALLVLPAGLVLFLSFNAGGYFPGTVALAGLVLILALAARIITVDRPFAALSPSLLVAAVALTLYACWALVSATWSDSAARALFEFDRVLLYLSALLLFGSVPRSTARIRWITRGLATAIFIICASGLITRVLPEVWPVAPNLSESRLSYPVTYWNTLGLLAAIGVILCFHFASSRSEARAVRVLGAGAVPILATTLYFTFSRGAILACVLGLVAYVALARPRGMLSGIFACVPTTTLALVAAYRADELAGLRPTSSAAIEQGHDVALAVALLTATAALGRLLLIGLDIQMDRLPPFRATRRAVVASAAAVVVSGVIIGIAVHLPQTISDQYERFVQGGSGGTSTDLRTRLTDPSNNGRIALGRTAIDYGYKPSKLTGAGAGTFELLWEEHRPAEFANSTVKDAHLLYVESLGELGLIGLALLLVAIGAVLFGFAAGLRGPNRTLYGALLAVGLAWAVKAGVDWDWEMPAVTLCVFMLGGAALAAPGSGAEKDATGWAPRAAATIPCLVIAVVLALVATSQARLSAGLDSFNRNDCGGAISSAQSSLSILGFQAEPYELAGYCEALRGAPARGALEMSEAIERDPHNWEYRYGLAVTRAAAGRDPRSAVRAAERLNPYEPLVQELVRAFRTTDPARWRQEGTRLLRRPLLDEARLEARPLDGGGARR